MDARLNQWIAGFADADDAPAANADVALDDAPMIEDDRVGDDQVEGRLLYSTGQRRLTLAVADDLASTELHFVAVDGVVFLDLDQEFGVGKADAVSGGWAVVPGVGGAREGDTHGRVQSRRPLTPTPLPRGRGEGNTGAPLPRSGGEGNTEAPLPREGEG